MTTIEEFHFNEKEKLLEEAQELVRKMNEKSKPSQEITEPTPVNPPDDTGNVAASDIQEETRIDEMLRHKVKVFRCKGSRCESAECRAFPDREDFVMDMRTPPYDRLHVLHSHYTHGENVSVQEILQKIKLMYMFTSVCSLKDFMTLVITKSKIIPIIDRLFCAELLGDVLELEYEYADSEEEKTQIKKDFGRHPLQYINKLLKLPESKSIAPTLRLNHIFKLVNSRDMYYAGILHFTDFVNDPELEIDYRYKSILSVEWRFTGTTKLRDRTLKRLCKVVLSNRKNPTMFRILSSQYIFRLEKRERYRSEAETIIVGFMMDTELCHELRADSADLLSQYGRPENQAVALEVLETLGGGRSVDVYSNKENVHSKGIEDSAMSMIKKLMAMPVKTSEDRDFERIVTKVLECMKEIYGEDSDETSENYRNSQKIKRAINRIRIDRVVSAKLSFTLKSLFVRVWIFIKDHKHYKELTKRLLQELIDMENTCFSGFAERLINTLSGYDDFMVTISFEDQIVAKFKRYINQHIMNIEDDNVRDNVLHELTLKTWNFSERKNVSNMLRVLIPKIQVDMYEEFKDYMNEQEFDMSIRKALCLYEINTFI